jgi:phosphatidylglycerol:prolipoprotein diacylglycerol transferase
MIPYFPEPILRLGVLPIHLAAVADVMAVLLSILIILRRAGRFGVSRGQIFRLWFWMYLGAMLGAHLYKAVVDDFLTFRTTPAIVFRIDLGLSTFGAGFGGLLAGAIWCRFHRLDRLDTFRRLDIMAYALPFAWLLGRFGCSLLHDHRGVAATGFLAIHFPGGSRYDLGMIEFLFLIPMCALFLILDRRPRAVGFFLATLGLLYGAFRVVLETWRVNPSRVQGVVAILCGICALVAMRAGPGTILKPAAAPTVNEIG